MTDTNILGNIMWEVLEKRQERTLDEKEREVFYTSFHADVFEKIEEIRSEQRRAYEEGKNLILA